VCVDGLERVEAGGGVASEAEQAPSEAISRPDDPGVDGGPWLIGGR